MKRKLIYFTASWCKSCQIFAPIFKEHVDGDKFEVEQRNLDLKEVSIDFKMFKENKWTIPALLEVVDNEVVKIDIGDSKTGYLGLIDFLKK
jgi:thiol-disulfide isomerase/thioredoxin